MSTDAAIAELSAGDVRAILDQRNRMRARNFGECVEIGKRCAVVDRDDGLGAASDEPLDGFRIDACVGGADVGEDRTRHACDRGVGRRGEGDCGDDDLVAGADAECFERDFERAGAGRGRNREASALVRGEGGRELSGLAIGARMTAPALRGEDVFELRAFAVVEDRPLGKGAGAKGLAAENCEGGRHWD